MHFGMNPREETGVNTMSTAKGRQQCNAGFAELCSNQTPFI